MERQIRLGPPRAWYPEREPLGVRLRWRGSNWLCLHGAGIRIRFSPDIEWFLLGHANRTVGDDYSMLKKNVKFRKQIADKIGVGFELPNSIWASVVPNVPKMAVEQADS